MSEGLKYDAGKPRVDLLPSDPLIEISKVLAYGASKYAEWNWANGIQYSRVYGAALRHMMAWKEGQDTDPETGISHLAHAACNLLFLLEFEKTQGSALDDRRK